MTAARRVGAFLHRFQSVAETKAWLDAGERTMTKRYVGGRTATFAKR